jgi:YHS domain-containing protein
MRKSGLSLGLTAAITLLVALPVLAGDQAPPIKPQTNCPVMGAKINRRLFAEYKDKRVYFCCGDCPAQFKKDPARYVAQLEAQGITLERIQTTCPVTGEKLKDKKVFADYKGKRVYFCCDACVAEFNKDPAKYIKKLEDAGVTPEATPPPPAQKPAQPTHH